MDQTPLHRRVQARKAETVAYLLVRLQPIGLQDFARGTRPAIENRRRGPEMFASERRCPRVDTSRPLILPLHSPVVPKTDEPIRVEHDPPRESQCARRDVTDCYFLPESWQASNGEN
jgi:hypothetical protein